MLLVPGAALQFLRQDGPEHRDVEEGELAGEILCGDGERVEEGGGVVGPGVGVAREAGGLGAHGLQAGVLHQVFVNPGGLGGTSLDGHPATGISVPSRNVR